MPEGELSVPFLEALSVVVSGCLPPLPFGPALAKAVDVARFNAGVVYLIPSEKKFKTQLFASCHLPLLRLPCHSYWVSATLSSRLLPMGRWFACALHVSPFSSSQYINGARRGDVTKRSS